MFFFRTKLAGLILILISPAIVLGQIEASPQAAGNARDRVYYPDDTENVKPLVKKLAGNLWLDQKEIWSSPFHMHKKDAKYWIGFSAAIAVSLQPILEPYTHSKTAKVK